MPALHRGHRQRLDCRWEFSVDGVAIGYTFKIIAGSRVVVRCGGSVTSSRD
jgi:hypothetical protein